MDKGEKKERRPPQTQTLYFCAVVQADSPEQMDAMRWMMQDRQYFVIAALHDKDTYTAEEITEKGTDGVYVRKNADGTESQYKAGDVKPAHYHLLIKTRAKMRAESLTKRFCSQVHFQTCSDRYEYARYLLHNTYSARDKYQYSADCLSFGGSPDESIRWYQEMSMTENDMVLDVVQRAIVAATDESGTKSRRAMLETVLQDRDAELLRSMMAHTHFYDNFVLGGVRE